MQRSTKRHTSGFTLLELSLVLVVIALIIGAVKVASDLQRQASYMRLISSHISGWQRAYSAYYDGRGYVLGDSYSDPRVTVDGANNPPGEICGLGVIERMLEGGISLPTGRGVGFEDRYGYHDSNGNPQDMQVCFKSVEWADNARTPGSYKTIRANVMVIKGVTPDLARMIDHQIDGMVDARFGGVREPQYAHRTDLTQSLEWSKNNLDPYTGVPGSATNESQIAVLEVWWRMFP